MGLVLIGLVLFFGGQGYIVVILNEGEKEMNKGNEFCDGNRMLKLIFGAMMVVFAIICWLNV